MSRVDAIRLELERVGVDEFCRRRYEREDMPLKLALSLSRASVLTDSQLRRQKQLTIKWTEPRLAVLECMVRGLRDKEIALERGCSIHTVKTQVKEVLRLLDARNRTHAVHLAHVKNLL